MMLRTVEKMYTEESDRIEVRPSGGDRDTLIVSF